MLVDSHCHLDFDSLHEDLDGVMERARAVGVSRLVTICTRVNKIGTIFDITRRYSNVYCTVGTHPHNADEESDISVDRLIELSLDPKCIGLGESGLDYHYRNASEKAQKAGFRRHISAARETGLPLVVHSRSADEDTMSILAQEMKAGAFSFVLHCFSAGEALARTGIELGGYISFSGIVTFKSAQTIRDAIHIAPLDRILVETDAPYLAPVPHRGTSNEPAFLPYTAACIATELGIDEQSFARQTSRNFDRLFKKASE